MPSPLIQAALEAQVRAYAPYSEYLVGAAVEDEQGRIHPGCNVENVSFGGSICAERAAVTRMITDGGKEIRRIAVVTKDGGAPCGICRQVLAEFARDPSKVEVHIVRAGEPEAATAITLAELLPFAFKSSQVARTDA